ncbi:MAG TPA: helix-turn-helix domain-containing protein [Thermoleophilaceae bacterium]|nr:helix-turn-helix domain-containing protein [Thermoleophilaceae bacterium]
MGSQSLPVIGSQAHERADAARNRERILDAARRLIDRQGIDQLSMDALAAEAGVGKGTIFRRFGDRAGLAHALLDEHESAFQEAFIRGEPPLGPGAPPVDRLRAFGHAMIDLLESHGDIILAAESGSACARFRAPAFRAHRAHVTSLLRELDPRLDAEYHADSLLAVLAADQHRHLRREREMPVERLRAGWDSVVAAVEALAGR